MLFPPRRLDYGLMRVCTEGALESRKDRDRYNWLVTSADGGLEFEFNASLVANKLTARDGMWLFGTGNNLKLMVWSTV